MPSPRPGAAQVPAQQPAVAHLDGDVTFLLLGLTRHELQLSHGSKENVWRRECCCPSCHWLQSCRDVVGRLLHLHATRRAAARSLEAALKHD